LGGTRDCESIDLLDFASEEELTDFVRFATDLDDGEASVCALALSRDGGVATDDRKALGLLHRDSPRVLTVQTPELLHDWARLSKAPKSEIGLVLRSIEQRARFRPRRGAPRYDWWSAILGIPKSD
jgi:hypothetical protein